MMSRLMASPQLGHETFEFELCTRPLDFTDVGGPRLQYYWMDGRQLRRGNCQNYRACVDSWWACMGSEGLTQMTCTMSEADREQVAANQINLVLASLYPLVAQAKGPRQSFRDAFPRRRPPARADAQDPGRYASCDSERHRLENLLLRPACAEVSATLNQRRAGRVECAWACCFEMFHAGAGASPFVLNREFTIGDISNAMMPTRRLIRIASRCCQRRRR